MTDSGQQESHIHSGGLAMPGMEPAAPPRKENGSHPGHGDGSQNRSSMKVADFRQRFWISLIITVPVLLLSPVIQELVGLGGIGFSGEDYLLWGLASGVYFYGGYPFLKGSYAELKSRFPGMMVLVSLAITVAYIYSSAVAFGLKGDYFFWELATLIDVMLLGHWLEMRSVMAASSALEELARLLPAEAHKISADGSLQNVPLKELMAGDRVLVRPGEKVPADGKVVSGETSVNEAMLTGESTPVYKRADSVMIGGSLNGEGAVTLEVQKTGSDSYLAQVAALVRAARENKSKTQNISDRAAMWLTLAALGGGVVTLLVWLIAAREEFVFALSRMVTVMVIACPHALGLAIPLVVAVSTSLSARSGLLVKDRDGFERARGVQAILFDKTGTLTLGKFGVTDIISFTGTSDQDLLKYAASLEAGSEHPIARGIMAAAAGEKWSVEDFKAIPGRGARGRVNGREVMVVSPGYLREKKIEIDNKLIDGLASQGKTVVFTLINGQPGGAIALADMVRPESRAAIDQIKKLGIRCMMLTGDNRFVAGWVAGQVGLDEYFAEVLPEEKAARVREVQLRGLKVAMTGDGVNDAPALAQADIGIAIGAGTDVAVAAADVVLVKSNPLDVVSIIKLSRATYRKMVQNLVWATAYNIVAIPLAAGAAYSAGVLLEPAAGAALMAISTIIVAVNARLLKMPGR